MYKEIYTKQFKKDVKLMKKQGKDIDLLIEVINTLREGKELDAKYKDHNLIGDWAGCRECHLWPNWLLIYKINKQKSELYLLRTGSHSTLLEESFSHLTLINDELDKILRD